MLPLRLMNILPGFQRSGVGHQGLLHASCLTSKYFFNSRVSDNVKNGSLTKLKISDFTLFHMQYNAYAMR